MVVYREKNGSVLFFLLLRCLLCYCSLFDFAWFFCVYIMVVLWLYHGCIMVISWLSCGYIMVVLWLYYSYIMVVLWLLPGVGRRLQSPVVSCSGQTASRAESQTLIHTTGHTVLDSWGSPLLT